MLNRITRGDRRLFVRSAGYSLLAAVAVSLAQRHPLDGRTWALAAMFGLTGLLVAGSEALIFKRRLRRLAFTPAFIIRFVTYEALVWGALLGIGHLLPEQFHIHMTRQGLMGSLLNSAKIALAINLWVEVRQLLGPHYLVNLLTGRYHRPRLEDRVLMFLDIKSSTTIAEQLGPVRFHQLIREFFFDVTDPIVGCGGEIYKYVGDEVIVSWKVARAQDHGRIVDCYFEMEESIRRNRAYYQRVFGLVPEFKAGLHIGPLVVGEMGAVRKEIALLGDTVNTAARIQGECNRFGRPLLVSREFLASCQLPARLRAESLGSLLLKGKQVEVELFGIEASRTLTGSLSVAPS